MLFAKEDHSRDPLTEKIIGAAIEVHRTLGPGFLESVYEECLCIELEIAGLAFQRQREWPMGYKGRKLEQIFRTDIVVEGLVLVEVKACEAVLPIHEAKALHYMKQTGLRKSLIINFNVLLLKDGISRFVL